MDAAALVAYLDAEPGHDVVAAELAGSSVSAVNIAEVLGRAARRGHDPGEIVRVLEGLGVRTEPFTEEDALAVARFAPESRSLGLSLADRACLALAARSGAVVLTADRALARADLGVHVELIR